MPRTPELGFYALAGQPKSPLDILHEMRAGEAAGFGAAFISERMNVKEMATLCGAAAAVTEQINIVSGVTNHNTRHPLITASHALTMHRMSGGRYVLGLGRGVATQLRSIGLAPVTSAQLEDFVTVLRRLFRGETIIDHQGPAGSWPVLSLGLGADLDETIPFGFAAFGPRSLALGGRVFDNVILHTFFTDETLQRCVRTIKRAAEQAGRDPSSVTVWSCLAVLPDHLSHAELMRKSVGRLSTYLQFYGDLLVKTNEWDPAVLRRFLADPLVASFGTTAIDARATTQQLEQLAELIPQAWLDVSAHGSAKECAREVGRQREVGADGVIMHGASPDELEPVMTAYRALHA